MAAGAVLISAFFRCVNWGIRTLDGGRAGASGVESAGFYGDPP